MAEPQRPGREWKQHDIVCPRRLAEAGQFVKARIVQAIEFSGYTPPGSYEYQTHLYIVEWDAPVRLAPFAQGHDVFLGNDLLPLEAAARCAIRAIMTQRSRVLEAIGLDTADQAAQAYLSEEEERARKFNPMHTGGRMADG